MKKTILLAGAAFFAAAFLGCRSVPEHISEDLDARQLIQLGQDNYDAHHYKAAEKYFNTVLERFGDDPKHYLEAKYELGHLYLKQKKYNAAYDNFTEIQEIYENVPAGLPGSYKILSGIELAKIPEEKIAEFKAKAEARAEEERAALEKERREAEEKRRREEAERLEKSRMQAALESAAQEAGAQEAGGQEEARNEAPSPSENSGQEEIEQNAAQN